MNSEKDPHQDGKMEENAECCNECGSLDIFTDYTRGERICANCGVVISSRKIRQGPEWRAFSKEDQNRRSRVGSPSKFILHDKGLTTVIDWRNKDAFGKKLPPRKRGLIHRLRKWQARTRVHSTAERNLAVAMTELERLSSQLDIPRGVRESAAVLYRRILEKKLTRGLPIGGIVAATLYAACRKRKIPRTLEEIASHSRVEWKALGRYYRILLRKLKITVPIASPFDFISRFGTELALSERTQRTAAKIIAHAREKGITAGKDPTGLAAAALYISSILEGERRTQHEIAQVAHVTEVTIRNRYKEFIKELNIRVKV